MKVRRRRDIFVLLASRMPGFGKAVRVFAYAAAVSVSRRLRRDGQG